MTTRQRYKRILQVIEGIAKVERLAARAEAAHNRSNIEIYTRAYAGLLGEALEIDPQARYIRVTARGR